MAKKKAKAKAEVPTESVGKEIKKEEEASEEETGENIVDEEKEAEAEGKEQDYNSIFDDEYIEDDKKDSETEEEVSEDKEEELEEESEPEEEGVEEPNSASSFAEASDDKEEEDSGKSSDSSSPKNKKDKSKSEKKKEDKEEEPEEEKNNEIILDKKDKKAKKISKKTVLITLTVILALLLGAFGGYLYFKNTNKPKEETKSEVKTEEPKKEETKKDVYVTADGGLNMRENPDKNAKVLVLIPNGTKLTVLEEQGDWYKVEYDGKTGWIMKDYVSEDNPLAYTNDDYGFQLTFPEKWSSYKVVKKDVDNGDGTSSPVLYVGIKVADTNYSSSVGKGYADMFAISVLTPAQWNTVKNGEGPQPAYIAENSKYVFVWSPSQAGPDEVTDEREQVNDILKTFKLL